MPVRTRHRHVVWLSTDDDLLVTSITPDGYTFHHVPREGRQGGGVGIMLKTSFCVALLIPWQADSFECLEIVLRGPSVPSTLRMFVIYQPPSSGRKATPFRSVARTCFYYNKRDSSYWETLMFTTEMSMTRTQVIWPPFSTILICNNT